MDDMPEIDAEELKLLEPALGDLGAMLEEVLGETERATLDYRGVRLRLATQPLAYDVRELYRAAGQTPAHVGLYRMSSVWLVSHHVGVLVPRGAPEVLALHYEAELRDQPVQTLDLQPQTEVERSALGVLGFGLNAEGEARVAPSVPLAGGIKLGLGAHLKIEGERAFASTTAPRVTAIGKGSTRCEWYFQTTGSPLVGDQSMFQLLLAPLHTSELSVWLRAGVTTRGRLPGIPVTRYTDWTEASIRLLPATT